jgi:septum site-determining protein MinD
MLLTRYDAARAARGDMLKVDDVLEILSIPLLGIIPESKEILRASNTRLAGDAQRPYQYRGKILFRCGAAPARAMTCRWCCRPIRSGFFDRLFGRRAA